jgi:hypothetical protein
MNYQQVLLNLLNFWTNIYDGLHTSKCNLLLQEYRLLRNFEHINLQP